MKNQLETENLLQPDFTKGIVLVTALTSDSVINYVLNVLDAKITEKILSTTGDIACTTMLMDDGLLERDGTIGRHLNFEHGQFIESFVDRPHIHWSWNGLVQPNSGGDWEASSIAYVEPLAAFENVLGFVPYDTTTVGAHRLSESSLIIVPDFALDGLKQKKSDYLGEFIAYNPKQENLRQATARIIKERFPNLIELVNKNGTEINRIVVSDDNGINHQLCNLHDYDPHHGHFNETYYRQNDGHNILLSTGADHIHDPSYHQTSEGRHIGLHAGSPTDIETDIDFILLQNLAKNPELVLDRQNQKRLIGFDTDKSISDLICIKVYEKYIQLSGYGDDTGIHRFAKYLLLKSMMADLRSIQAESKNGPIPTPNQLARMILNHYKNLYDALGKLHVYKDKKSFLAYREALATAYCSVIFSARILIHNSQSCPSAKRFDSKLTFWQANICPLKNKSEQKNTPPSTDNSGKDNEQNSKASLVSRVAKAIRTNTMSPELIGEIQSLDKPEEIESIIELQKAVGHFQPGQCNPIESINVPPFGY